MARSNAAEKPVQEPLALLPTMEEVTASFAALSTSTRRVEDLAGELKIAKEEHKAALESHLRLGRRFELAQSARKGAEAMADHIERQDQAAANVKLLPPSDTIYAGAGVAYAVEGADDAIDDPDALDADLIDSGEESE